MTVRKNATRPRQQWLTLIGGILVPMMGAATAAVRDDNA